MLHGLPAREDSHYNRLLGSLIDFLRPEGTIRSFALPSCISEAGKLQISTPVFSVHLPPCRISQPSPISNALEGGRKRLSQLIRSVVQQQWIKHKTNPFWLLYTMDWSPEAQFWLLSKLRAVLRACWGQCRETCLSYGLWRDFTDTRVGKDHHNHLDWSLDYNPSFQNISGWVLNTPRDTTSTALVG